MCAYFAYQLEINSMVRLLLSC